MTEFEVAICKKVFAEQVGLQATPQQTHVMLTTMAERLEAAGSYDGEGKALGYMFWVVMTAAMGGARRKA